MKCDMHIHSNLSEDSFSKPEKIVAAAKRAGMDGIVLANHDRVMPKETLESLRDRGVLIIPAAEYSTDVGHVLALFTEEHIGILGVEKAGKVYPYRETIDAIHKLGGVAVLAHPSTDGKEVQEEVLRCFDGVEAANSRSGYRAKGRANVLAAAAAEQAGLQTAGSDSHFLFEIGRSYVELPVEPPYTREKLLAALGDRPKIVSRPTNPMVLTASQIYKNGRAGHYLGACKQVVKLLLRLPMLAPRLFGVTPYHREY
ncbi:MAG: CehA/McbA family metallohydrolase [Oscillospiraceae bacterium]